MGLGHGCAEWWRRGRGSGFYLGCLRGPGGEAAFWALRRRVSGGRGAGSGGVSQVACGAAPPRDNSAKCRGRRHEKGFKISGFRTALKTRSAEVWRQTGQEGGVVKQWARRPRRGSTRPKAAHRGLPGQSAAKRSFSKCLLALTPRYSRLGACHRDWIELLHAALKIRPGTFIVAAPCNETASPRRISSAAALDRSCGEPIERLAQHAQGFLDVGANVVDHLVEQRHAPRDRLRHGG